MKEPVSLLDYADDDRKSAYGKSRRPHGLSPICKCCGAPLVEFKHTLSKQLGEILIRLYRKGGSAQIRELFLSYSAASNAQKLRYWDLITHRTEEDRRKGIWSLTEKGEQFVRVTIRLPKHAWSYRGKTVELEGDPVLITDLVKDFNSRISFAQEARPHETHSAN